MVADVYRELREAILKLDPHAHGWGPTAELTSV